MKSQREGEIKIGLLGNKYIFSLENGKVSFQILYKLRGHLSMGYQII